VSTKAFGSRLVIALILTIAVLSSASPVAAARRAGAPESALRVSPTRVAAADARAVTFTFTNGSSDITNGTFRLSVPRGWAAPSTSSINAGRVVASAGIVTVRGRSIAVVGTELPRGSKLVVTYGGGPSGVTAPTATGRYTFDASMTASSGGDSAAVAPAPVVTVTTPNQGCRAAEDPAGATSPGLRLPNGIARANLHNTAQATGILRQCFSADIGMTTSFTLAGVAPVGHGPLGYPEAAYGYDAYGQPHCPGCRAEPFPLPVSELGSGPHDYSVAAHYSLHDSTPDSLPLDFIFDFWLEQRPVKGVAPQPGDVELLVFLYERNIAGCADEPFAPVSFSTPALFDGRPVYSTWRVCEIRGGTAATPIAFFLQTPTGSQDARVSLRIADFVQEAASYLRTDLDAHLLMGVELGGEFNQCDPGSCTAPEPSWGFRISHLSVTSTSATIPIIFTK
jgi:hypothetical protein